MGSRWRGLVLYGVMIALTVGAIEVISWVGLRFLYDRWVAYSFLAAQQSRAAAASATKGMDLAESAAHQPEFISQKVAHPFVGGVLDRNFMTSVRRANGGEEALDFGFNLVEPGIFERPAAGTAVVALTGGSVANGFAMQGADRFRAALLSRLRPRVSRIHLVNLALPGYKQPQQLMILAYLLSLGAHFDAVVNLDGFNEIAVPPTENVKQGVFPFFPRSWYYETKDFDPGMRMLIGELSFLRQRRASLAEAFSRSPWRYSLTAGVLWTLLDRRVTGQISTRALALQNWKAHSAGSFTVTGPPRHYANTEAMLTDLAAVWARGSLQMSRLARGNGIRYYHFLQPNQYVPGSKPMSPAEKRLALDLHSPYAFYVVKGYPLLLAQGTRLVSLGVRFTDLTKLFATVKQPLYIDSCCHVNNAGYEMMASAMAAEILKDTP
jgi:hypothetical protein